MKASEEVGTDTALLLHSQQSGFSQTLSRHKKEIQSLIDAETINIANLNNNAEMIHNISIPLNGIDTVLANNARRTLQIRFEATQADLVGAKVRLTALQALLVKME